MQQYFGRFYGNILIIYHYLFHIIFSYLMPRVTIDGKNNGGNNIRYGFFRAKNIIISHFLDALYIFLRM